MSEFDAIPDELTGRDQWLLWDSSADTPRRPHWDGDFYGISWSDPEDWHSFQEAVELAESVESWGVGYVMALDNDNHARGLYGCLDLDGCIEEDGGPKDWLPSLEPFLKDGAYAEYSASGTGIHIPLVGQKPPEWWSDSHFSADEHEGVEYLTNKFVAFTGDAMEGCVGAEVADTNPAPFLFDAYKQINGESPRFDEEASQSRRTTDDEFTDQQIENALSALNASCEYPLWRNLAFAVHDWDSGSTGKSIFESWSRSSSAWDEQSQRLIDNIWNNSKQGDGITVGTLIHHAMEAGWSPGRPKPTNNTTPSPSGEVMGWEEVRELFADPQVDDKRARRWAAIALTERHDYVYVDTDDRLLKYYEEDGVFEAGGERHVRKVLARELGMQFSTHDRNEVLATVQDLSAVDVTTLNAEEFDEKLLCLKNGVLDLETRELQDHSPKYKFTQTVPVDYDPEATAPEIEQFLDDVTQSRDERDTLVEMVGATLHPQYLKSKFLFLFGEGSNGKGVYFELINRLLGPENVEGRGLHELADNRFAKADLHGKLANIGGDIDDRKLQNVGTIKRLTSNTDPITAERKFGQPFKFVNSATLFFAANEPPAIDDMKRSMGRRLVPIHMATEFVENPDPEDPFQKKAVDQEKLLAAMSTDEELSGLLNMALDGMDRLRDTSDVSLELSPMERLEFYQRFSDPIYRFANDCLNKEPGVTVEKADVYEIYKSFSRAEGHGVRHNNVFWREFRRVFHFEETQPRLDDGSKGPRKLLDTRVTEKGLKYAPSHLEEKYGHMVEDDAEEADSEGSAPTFETIEPGRHTLEVTVAEVLEPKPWQQGRGHLSDEAGNIMPYVAEGSENPLLAFSEDDTVQIKNARVATDRDGVLRVEISGVCEVSSKEETGPLTVDDREPNSQQVEETATDGSGEEQKMELEGEPLAPQIMQYVMDSDVDVEHDDLVDALLDRGAAKKQIEHWVEKCLQRGDISEPEEGMYRR